jgi:hypothetical protein
VALLLASGVLTVSAATSVQSAALSQSMGRAARSAGLLPLVPARLVDTRPGATTVDGQGQGTGLLAAGGVLQIPLLGRAGIPADGVGAVMLNVTAVEPTGSGYLTVYPCDAERPLASNVNYVAGQVVPNAVLAKVGGNGTVCVFTLASTHIVVDVNGWAATGSAGLMPVVPARLADTRPGAATVDGQGQSTGVLAAGGVLQIPMLGRAGLPAAGVGAVMLNVTAVEPAGAGFLTVYPCDAERPLASNVNYVAGQVVPNAVLAKVSADGAVCVFTLAATHIVVDVNGWAATGSAGLMPVVPARLADTRPGAVTVDGQGTSGGGSGQPAAGGVVRVFVLRRAGLPAEGVGAVMLNVTVVEPTAAGYLTVYPCDEERPLASNVNYVAGQVVPNAVLAKVGGDGAVCVYSFAQAHIVVDVNGWSRTAPPLGALARVTDPPFPFRDSLYGSVRWARAEDALLYRSASGGLAIATVDQSARTITVVTYDASTIGQVGPPVTLSFDGWDQFGGLYATPNGDLYLLVGRANTAENDDADVIEVRHYGPTLQLLGAARLKGGVAQGVKGVYRPFDFSAADMLLVSDRLVVHMGRIIYGTPDGLHHQVNLTFEVDVNTMTATVFEQLGGYSYSSHSFRQMLASDGPNLLLADHGDGYPRSIRVGVMADYPTQRAVTTYDLLQFNGGIGNNFTGATLTGMSAGSAGTVVVGTSIQHPGAPGGPLGTASEHPNVYVATLTTGTGAHNLQWLTTFPATGGPSASEPRIIKIDDQRFAVLFTVVDGTSYRTEYRLIDAAGSVIASETFPGMQLARPLNRCSSAVSSTGWQDVPAARRRKRSCSRST